MISAVSDCVLLTLSSGTFQSPGHPSNYPYNVNVCWLFQGGNYVRASFPYFNTELNEDYVRVYGGNSTSAPLLLEASGAFAGGFASNTVVSPTDQMLVAFNSNSNTDENSSGFSGSYSHCSEMLSSGGSITSPNYPGNYDNFDSVCWVISPPDGYTVTFSFNEFSTELDFDLVRLFDGNSTNSPVLLSASGDKLPTGVTSSSNSMLVVFTSDFHNVFKGFEAIYITQPATTTTATTTTELPTTLKVTPVTKLGIWFSVKIRISFAFNNLCKILRFRMRLYSFDYVNRQGHVPVARLSE